MITSPKKRKLNSRKYQKNHPMSPKEEVLHHVNHFTKKGKLFYKNKSFPRYRLLNQMVWNTVPVQFNCMPTINQKRKNQ